MREWMNEMNDNEWHLWMEWNGMEWGACRSRAQYGFWRGRCRRRSVWRAQLKMECNVMEWMQWNGIKQMKETHEWIGMHKKWKHSLSVMNAVNGMNAMNAMKGIHVEFHPQATFNPGPLATCSLRKLFQDLFLYSATSVRLFEFLLLDCLFSASLLFLRPFQAFSNLQKQSRIALDAPFAPQIVWDFLFATLMLQGSLYILVRMFGIL